MRIVEHLLARFQEAEGKNLSDIPQAMQRIREAAERCKIDLSTLETANVNLPYIFENKNLDIDITREQFNKMTEDFVKKTISIIEKTLQDARLSPSEIDEVIFVGGSTRIPAVVKAVEGFMGKKALQNINPDEVVAMGGLPFRLEFLEMITSNLQGKKLIRATLCFLMLPLLLSGLKPWEI